MLRRMILSVLLKLNFHCWCILQDNAHIEIGKRQLDIFPCISMHVLNFMTFPAMLLHNNMQSCYLNFHSNCKKLKQFHSGIHFVSGVFIKFYTQ